MALSAAFAIAVIIIGVANTGGSIASLNWFARCAGVTRSVKVPFAPSGIGRMRHHRCSAVEAHPRAGDPCVSRRTLYEPRPKCARIALGALSQPKSDLSDF